jgi:hypothetical protein
MRVPKLQKCHLLDYEPKMPASSNQKRTKADQNKLLLMLSWQGGQGRKGLNIISLNWLTKLHTGVASSSVASVPSSVSASVSDMTDRMSESVPSLVLLPRPILIDSLQARINHTTNWAYLSESSNGTLTTTFVGLSNAFLYGCPSPHRNARLWK